MPVPPAAPAAVRLPRPVRLAALGLLVLAALGVRWHGLGDPLVNFHSLRHYRSALIARSCFDDARPETPAWALAIAHANRDIQQAGEPPLSEWVACAAYRLEGRENLIIPRALTGFWWVLGAIPLWLIVTRLVSSDASIVAAALYLFLPYSIAATRTFQPDPLMTSCALWAVAALLRYHDRASGRRLVVAAIAVGVALLVKPMSVFVVIPATIGLARARGRWRAVLVDRGVWLLLAIAFVPPGLYYGHSVVFGTLAEDQFQTRFVPSLLPTTFFWGGLLRQVHRVVGWPIFAAAVAGTLVARQALARVLLRSIWIGYAAFAVAFTYHMPTHDYYHLPFLPIAAIAAAALFDRAIVAVGARRGVRSAGPSSVVRSAGPSGPAGPAATAVAVAAAIVIAVRGAWIAWPTLTVPHAAEIAADYVRIGDATGHSGRVLFLDLEYGYPLMYHGQVAGDTWPGVDDLNAERLDGRPALTAAARFTRDYAGEHPAYFVVTDFDSLDEEADLRALLAAKTVVVDETPRHRVYKFVTP